MTPASPAVARLANGWQPRSLSATIPSALPTLPDPLVNDRRLTLLLARVLMYLLLLICGYLVLQQLAPVITPVAVALVLAFLLDPSVRSLESRGVPRWLAVLLLIAAFAGFITILTIALPHLVSRELERFQAQLPTYERFVNTKLLPKLAGLLKERRLANLHDWSRLFSDRIGEWVRSAAGEISGAVESALVGFFGVLRVLLAVLLVPVFAISFLMNMPKLMSQVRRMVPPRNQELASAIVHDLHAALGGWLRGQLTVMLIQAALYSIGLSLAQVPLAVVIGCTAGLLAFVPYVGVSIGLLAALLVALLDVGTRGATPILGVLVTFGSVQVLDAVLITPRAVGGRVGLSMVGVIFALSLGANLLGYAGLLLAVPVAAALKAIGPRLIDVYYGSRFYQAGLHAERSAETPTP